MGAHMRRRRMHMRIVLRSEHIGQGKGFEFS
jgi:hypothetical protein